MTGLGQLENESEQMGEVGSPKQSMLVPRLEDWTSRYFTPAPAGRAALDRSFRGPNPKLHALPAAGEIELQPVTWEVILDGVA